LTGPRLRSGRENRTIPVTLFAIGALFMIHRIWLALLCVTIVAFAALGDTIHLKDGTTIDGRVIDQGDKYWVKDASGQSRFVDKTDVLSVTQSTAPAAIPTAAGNSPAARPAYAGSGNFSTVKLKANQSETAIAAVGLWQAFIESKPSATDLAGAKVELKHWQDVVNGSGEKINGKWIWGDDRDKLIAQVRKLMLEGNEALRNNQTIVGIEKFEQAVKLYPNNFQANFDLGYFNLVKGVEGGRNNAKIDAGIKSLEMAVKLRPNCAAALSDLAIGYSFRQKYQLSVQTAYKAAKIEDSKGIVQNLVDSIAFAPPGMQNNSNVKPIIEETLILAAKYSIPLQTANWEWVRPDPESVKRESAGSADDEDEKNGPPGIFAEGTGFFISANGYIMTNRHVAKPGDYLMVRLPDNTLKLGQRVVIDDEQDMAVIKIAVSDPVPFVRLAGYDHPPVGADVAVFGFPLLDRFGLKSSVKMTRGIVTAWDKDNQLCDVTVDAIVNPGNSGGPMVDHHGNLLAITAMKTISTGGMISTYGLGYSTERIRKFFEKQKAKLIDAKLVSGKDDGAVLTNEDLATRLTPVTVCILNCRGTPPAAGGDGTLQDVKDPAAGN
jgi:S1-C subfamily serine protease